MAVTRMRTPVEGQAEASERVASGGRSESLRSPHEAERLPCPDQKTWAEQAGTLNRRRARCARAAGRGAGAAGADGRRAARGRPAGGRDVHRGRRDRGVRGVRARLPDRRAPGPGTRARHPSAHRLPGRRDRSRTAERRGTARLPEADRRLQRPVRRGALQPRAPGQPGSGHHLRPVAVRRYDQPSGRRHLVLPHRRRRVADLARGLRRQPGLRAEAPRRQPGRDIPAGRQPRLPRGRPGRPRQLLR